MLLFLGQETGVTLALQPGIELTPTALEGEVLTTGPPRKPLENLLLILLGGYLRAELLVILCLIS